MSKNRCIQESFRKDFLEASSVGWYQFFISIQKRHSCRHRKLLYVVKLPLSSNHWGFFSANKVSTSTRGKGGRYLVGIVSCPILYQCFFAPLPAGPPVFGAFTLPPGEKGSSALETLCVGLAVGSLGCSGCFNNYWGHLDKL